jgi:hypothetical protein
MSPKPRGGETETHRLFLCVRSRLWFGYERGRRISREVPSRITPYYSGSSRENGTFNNVRESIPGLSGSETVAEMGHEKGLFSAISTCKDTRFLGC